MANKRYPVQWNLNHDGKEFGPGDEISLAKKDAAPLLDAGVIVDPAANVDADEETAGEDATE